MSKNAMDLLVAEIRAIMEAARSNLSREVNTTMLNTYWQVGRTIVEREQNGELKAQYGTRLLTELSKRLSNELGRGYSRSNLYNMRELYMQYPKIQTTSGKLSWSHYLELLSVKDKDARAFYEHECENAKWSAE
jgi:predicted nuclease of restriction endonuclease-like (RecB) superfamily